MESEVGGCEFDAASKRVQADEFQGAVERALKGYADAIRGAPVGDDIWKKCTNNLAVPGSRMESLSTNRALDSAGGLRQMREC